MNEDRARNRCDNGPKNLAILKHMTINKLNAEPSRLPIRHKMKKAERYRDPIKPNGRFAAKCKIYIRKFEDRSGRKLHLGCRPASLPR